MNTTSTPSRRTRRRDKLATKTDSELTNETTQSTFSGMSFGSKTTSEASLQHVIASQNGIQQNVLLYRQPSVGPSCSALNPPPRLMRESSSESTGSVDRKRSIHGTSAQQQCSFGGLDDEELIREQHEIMKQIQQEQHAFHRLKKTDKDKPNQSVMTTPGQHKNGTMTDVTTIAVTSSPLWSPTASTPLLPPTSTIAKSAIKPSLEDEKTSSFFLDIFVDDPDMMREQQQIMDEIMRQRVTSTAKVPSISTPPNCFYNNIIHDNFDVSDHVAPQPFTKRKPPPLANIGVTTNNESHALSPGNTPLSVAFACIPRPQYTKSSSSHSQEATNTPAIIYNTEEDSSVEFYGEKSLRIKGTRHTWKEIELGRATIVQCPCCSTFLQVSRKATLLFCTKCEEISTVVIHEGKSTSDDGRIARVVQQQERQVAYSRKNLKSADTGNHTMR